MSEIQVADYISALTGGFWAVPVAVPVTVRVRAATPAVTVRAGG